MTTYKCHDVSLTKLKQKIMVGFAFPMLLPGTAATIKAKGLLYISSCGESLPRNQRAMEKIGITFTLVTSISSIEVILIAMANLKAEGLLCCVVHL